MHRGDSMICIHNDRCCCCGHCQFIRFSLPLVKTVGDLEYHEDPRPEDMKFVENIAMECQCSAIEVNA